MNTTVVQVWAWSELVFALLKICHLQFSWLKPGPSEPIKVPLLQSCSRIYTKSLSVSNMHLTD